MFRKSICIINLPEHYVTITKELLSTGGALLLQGRDEARFFSSRLVSLRLEPRRRVAKRETQLCAGH